MLFRYDPSTGNTHTMVQASASYCLEYASGNLGALDYIQFDVVNRGTGTTVNFDNVVVNGVRVGSFVGSGWSTWHVTGIDLTNSFTIEGYLVIAGPYSSQETNKLQITAGHLP